MIEGIYNRGNEPKIQKDLVFVANYKGDPWLFRNTPIDINDKIVHYDPAIYYVFRKLSQTDPLGKMPKMYGFLYSECGHYIVILKTNSIKIVIAPKNNMRDTMLIKFMNKDSQIKELVASWLKYNQWSTPQDRSREITINNCNKQSDILLKVISIEEIDKLIYSGCKANNQIVFTYKTLGEDKYLKLLELIFLKYD